MAFSSKTLFQGTLATTSLATVYTAPANKRTRIDKFTATNVTSSAATLEVQIIESGGSAGDRYKVYHSFTIDGQDTQDLTPMRHMLETGDFVQIKSDTASAITCRASGTEIT